MVLIKSMNYSGAYLVSKEKIFLRIIFSLETNQVGHYSFLFFRIVCVKKATLSLIAR